MKKCLLIIYMCIPALLLSGCGGIYANYREVEQLQLVRSVGFDSVSDGVELTVASAKSPEGGETALLSFSGRSIAGAAQEMHDYSGGKELFFAHTEHILVGEQAAASGIGELLGYVQRSTVMRLSAELYIVRSDTARGVMTAASDSGSSVSDTLSAIKRNGEVSGFTRSSTCLETSRSLAENGACLVAALCLKSAGGALSPPPEGGVAVPDGFAILGDGRLAGFIERDEAPAACILTGHPVQSCFFLPCPGGGTATVRLTESSVRLRPEWDGDRLCRIAVEVSADSVLVELSEPVYSAGDSFLKGLGEALSQELERETRAVLEAEKELELDFLALGPRLRETDGERFDDLAAPFSELLCGLDFEVEANCTVGRSSDLDGSVRYGEEVG